MPTISIDPTERWILLGKTGSGKTQAAKHYLNEVARKWRVVLIDPKNMWLGKYPTWAGKKELGNVYKPRLVTKFDKKLKVQCFQPDPENLWGNGLERLCYDVFKEGKTFIYFDELDQLVSANSIPGPFSTLWTKGRQVEIGAWAASQRCLRIPEIVKSQAEKWLVFNLPGKKDPTDAETYIHISWQDIPIKDYKYWYYDANKMDRAIAMPALKLKR